MGIKHGLFSWFKAKNEKGEEMNLGYVLDEEPKTEEDLKKLFQAFGLESKFELFKPLIRSKIDIDLFPETEGNIGVGQSKIGGRPDLPLECAWPKTDAGKSLAFVAQLNCEQTSTYDKESLLPKQGIISFFYCADQAAWGFDPKDKDRFKVIYTEDLSKLKRIEFPDDLEEYVRYSPNSVKFDKSLSLPGWEHDCIDEILTDPEIDSYMELSRGSENQVFGYADCIQRPMELECQLVTNGLFCGDATGYEDPKRKELEAGSKDWTLLFQLDTEEEKAEMMWGDGGKLYFWIRKEDLKAKNFDKSWLVLQC